MLSLAVNSASKTFLNERNEEIIALSDLSFECKESEFLCIVGPTGCGKTTLLRLIAGLEKPTSGKILIDNQTVDGLSEDTTLVFQQYSLFPWRNVIDNIAFSMEMKNIHKKVRYEKAETFISLVGLKGFEKAFP